MNIPVIKGVIDRRVLVNFRVDPDVLATLLPSPFCPKLIHRFGMVGICLIRLKSIRPTLLPSWLGISSENAAHRAAVEWDDHGTLREGVYVRRRDTNSWLNAFAGGRLFPGRHHRARFIVNESQDRLEIAMRSDDGQTTLLTRGHRTDRLPFTSVFSSLDEASMFFQAGSVGYSPTDDLSRFQGMELQCHNWHVEPLEIEEVHSSFFDDSSLFPSGSIEFDNALLMRNIRHQWHSREDICCPNCRTGHEELQAIEEQSQL